MAIDKFKLFKSYVVPNSDGCIDRRDKMNNELAIKTALECFCELLLTQGRVDKIKEIFTTTGNPVSHKPTDYLPVNDSGEYDFSCIELFQNGLRVDDIPCRNPYIKITDGVVGVFTQDANGVESEYIAGTEENPCCWTLKYEYITPFSEILECIGKTTDCAC